MGDGLSEDQLMRILGWIVLGVVIYTTEADFAGFICAHGKPVSL